MTIILTVRGLRLLTREIIILFSSVFDMLCSNYTVLIG